MEQRGLVKRVNSLPKKKYVGWENTLDDKINLNKQVVWSVSVLWMGGKQINKHYSSSQEHNFRKGKYSAREISIEGEYLNRKKTGDVSNIVMQKE